ncbi:hypothetical protein BJ684DRAFT_16696 [Piptocephalis cylindrospora]|uniref:F-box domain-containing protein n=1 Tax=Piptocephalis cylindrospora TaxID=1907219 RepID=A0A4P9Y408_9FUNG|nr:hypothetical protein BJ684DRAFT_16696 [Piptocephalis cylindrospora]|eukprot:RKP12861.1 hypothetical protein BJ684DRAFT_16696 [Piptocephalis cylindrospora]
MTRLDELPIDVLFLLHGFLQPRDALALGQTCRGLWKSLGVTGALIYRSPPTGAFTRSEGPFPPAYLAFPRGLGELSGDQTWRWLSRLVYHETVEASWSSHIQGSMRNPLPRPFRHGQLLELAPATRPGLHCTEESLIAAYNQTLHLLPATGVSFSGAHYQGKVIQDQPQKQNQHTPFSKTQVSAMSPGMGEDVYLGDTHGGIARWSVSTMKMEGGSIQKAWGSCPSSSAIQSLSGTPNGCWSTSLDQILRLWDDKGHVRAEVPLGSRPWSSLSLASGEDRVVVGKDGRGSQNLVLYAKTSSGIERVRDLGVNRSAIYGLSQPRRPSWLHPGGGQSQADVFASASFDGSACLWDLRRSQAMVTSLESTLNDDPLYSVCWDGWRVGTGGARHGRVDIWDVRFPSRSLEVLSTPQSLGFAFAGKEESPVYALHMDGARIVVALERSVQMMYLSGVVGQDDFEDRMMREEDKTPSSNRRGRRRRRRGRGSGISSLRSMNIVDLEPGDVQEKSDDEFKSTWRT